MSKTAPSIIFFGNEKLATGIDGSCLILKKLVDSGYNIAALVINQQNADDKAAALPSVRLASEHSIPVFSPKHLTDIAADLAQLDTTIGVVAAYGRIIPEELLSIFPLGLLNVHPSLLPQYRGPTPIESAILNGDSKTGVSLIKLVAEMDAGPIFAQAELELDAQITKQTLAHKLTQLGADMLLQYIPQVLSGELKPVSQNETEATYCTKIQKTHSQIDWHQPAETIERQVRAYAGWPGSRAEIWGKEVIITQAHLESTVLDGHKPGEIYSTPESLMIAAVGGCISVDKLKPAGKNEMTAAEFIRGYRK